jgi:hypothetical protein
MKYYLVEARDEIVGVRQLRCGNHLPHPRARPVVTAPRRATRLLRTGEFG